MDTILRQLNSREKIIFLENILNNLYETAGQIQCHLESLADIERNIQVSVDKDKTVAFTDQSILCWEDLHKWCERAFSLSSQTLYLIYTRCRSLCNSKLQPNFTSRKLMLMTKMMISVASTKEFGNFIRKSRNRRKNYQPKTLINA